MTQETTTNRTAEECKSCENWGDVRNPVRVHTVFNTLMDKIENRVMDVEFKATTSDLMRVWDAVQTMDPEPNRSGGGMLQWAEPGETQN
ncbi:MAG TPA: hypothetical protein VG456_22080 [Candidatus Sulfopaludibacter sp.]|jgi:hypothetical protein|nr:hypothetical protein [Candidatus Sulfopaludibacter sp.]